MTRDHPAPHGFCERQVTKRERGRGGKEHGADTSQVKLKLQR